MGMYSTFVKQNLLVTNEASLMKLRENSELNLSTLISEDGKVDFSAWSDQKVYGYHWKDEVLKELAKSIEGWAEFFYEEGFKFRFVFKNGKAYTTKEKEVVYEEARETN